MERCSDHDIIEVLSDDPESLHDIPALCFRKGYECNVIKSEDQVFTFIISKYKTNPNQQHSNGTMP